MRAAPACFSHFRPPFRLISPHERRSRNMTARIVGHFRPPFRLISLHERRSRNMMARVVQRELSVLSNLIRAVKRSPETSSREPFVPQTPPPGHTSGRRGGASMVSLPSAGYSALPGEYERGRSVFPKRRLSAGCRLRQGWARSLHASPREWGSPEGANRRLAPFGAILLVLFCSRQKRTLLHRRWPPRRQPAKAKELIHKKSSPRRSPPARTAKNNLIIAYWHMQ